MDKRTITGLLIIFAAILFFNSEFYYEKLLKRPHPNKIIEQKQKEKQRAKKGQQAKKAESGKQIPEESIGKQTEIQAIAEKSVAVDSTVSGNTVRPYAPRKPVYIETPDYICRIERDGAVISSWQMKKYRPQHSVDSGELAELIPVHSDGVVNLSFNGKDYDSLAFHCLQADSMDTVRVLDADEKLTLTFVHEADNGGAMEKEFTFYGNDYRVGLTLRKRNIGTGKLILGWNAGLNEVDKKEGKKKNKQRSGPGGYSGYLFNGEDVEEIDDFKDNSSEASGTIRWVALNEGYFGSAVILDHERDISVTFQEEIDNKVRTQLSYSIKEDFEDGELKYDLFAGPRKHALLKSYDLMMEKTIFQGYSWFFRADIWFPKLCGLVLWLLNYFYSLMPDYGFAIILLTIISRLIMIPLTNKSQKSMAAMKDLNPKMAEIKAKYKSDPTKMNTEMMKLYKKHGVSPFGMGCLPMFLQMPVFISLFVSLRKAIELRGADTFLPWITDLSQPDTILHLPFEIPFYGPDVCLLPILMAVATFFQNKMTMKDPNQKAMVYMMPVFFLFLFNSFPAGLNLYWTLSTVIGIIQQIIIERKKNSEREAAA